MSTDVRRCFGLPLKLPNDPLHSHSGTALRSLESRVPTARTLQQVRYGVQHFFEQIQPVEGEKVHQPNLVGSFPPQRPDQLGKVLHHERFELVRFVVGVRLEQLAHPGRRVDPRQGQHSFQLVGTAGQK